MYRALARDDGPPLLEAPLPIVAYEDVYRLCEDGRWRISQRETQKLLAAGRHRRARRALSRASMSIATLRFSIRKPQTMMGGECDRPPGGLLKPIRLLAAAAALVSALAPSVAMTQAWPTKPIRIIVPHAPGGVTDVVTRLLSQSFSEALGAAGGRLPQTFCDYAGTALPGGVHSRSLRPLIERDDVTRDFARSEWDLRASRCGVDLHLRTVRTQRHKLTLELDSGAGELYDLVEDPQEMFNRFDDQSYAAVRRELSDMIASRPADAVAPLPQVGMA